ncbi:MAG TPA: hypothetical protein PK573_17270, partial [Spirochaetota bacterium]|nr:hypothetical protein [Spirochaetota bacterium]
MEEKSYKFVGKKVILRVKNRVCETPEELLASGLFLEVLKRCIRDIMKKDSLLGELFNGVEADYAASCLISSFKLLSKLPIRQAVAASSGEEALFLRDPQLLSAFVEHLYNYWRGFDRYVICDSEGDALDRRPYRTFN